MLIIDHFPHRLNVKNTKNLKPLTKIRYKLCRLTVCRHITGKKYRYISLFWSYFARKPYCVLCVVNSSWRKMVELYPIHLCCLALVMNILSVPTDILFIFVLTNVLIVSHFGYNHLLNALNVNVVAY